MKRSTSRTDLKVGPRLVLVLGAWWCSSCAPSGFQDISLIQNGVRILTSSATKPYVNPGDTVTVKVLAYDGRTAAQHAANPQPMHLYWLPFLCEDPAQDAYYSCFSQFGTALGGDGGTGSGLGVEPPSGDDNDGVGATPCTSADSEGGTAGSPGTQTDGGTFDVAEAGPDATSAASDAADAGAAFDGDATLAAPVVSGLSFSIPRDAVSAHVPVPGTTPYGLLIAFNVACAGELKLFPVGSNPNPQALPIQCVDPTNGDTPVGPESYVFGFSRIYAYEPDSGVTNNNPVLVALDVEPQGPSTSGAQTIPLSGGPSIYQMSGSQPLLVPRCAPGVACPNVKIGPIICPASWEPTAGGHEEIWADYYTTFGGFTDSSRLIYDPHQGLIGAPSFTDTQFQPPSGPDDGFIWVVVHDDRGGASWVTVPVHLVDP